MAPAICGDGMHLLNTDRIVTHAPRFTAARVLAASSSQCVSRRAQTDINQFSSREKLHVIKTAQ